MLEIGGSAPIEVKGSGGGVSEETVLEILMSNLTPALMNLIRTEIFEEGDGTYEY